MIEETNSITLRFIWDESFGEGNIHKPDIRKLDAMPFVARIDFLADVIADCTKLQEAYYEAERVRIAKGMSDLNGKS